MINNDKCYDKQCIGLTEAHNGHFIPPGDFPDPGIKSASPASPALQSDSFPLSHWGGPCIIAQCYFMC